MKPALIIHGGAGSWQDVSAGPVLEAMQAACAPARDLLLAGGSALDVVERAVMLLEEQPLFDAGRGSYLNRSGEVEMDALIIDAQEGNFGAVSAVRRVRSAIQLARLVMEKTPYSFFTGAGADALAAELGLPLIPNIELVTEGTLRLFQKHRAGQPQPPEAFGTVGAVALDAEGRLASATSTGGIPNKPAGRVGDTPLFGSGGYADRRYGAASATGVGEHIMRVLLSKYAIDCIGQGQTAQQAATAAGHYINGFFDPSEAGIIIVDREGRIGAAHTTARMPIAWVEADGTVRASMGGGLDGTGEPA